MNTQALKGTWEEIKGSLKAKYAHLTDDDLKISQNPTKNGSVAIVTRGYMAR